jgi:hypothetical protein
VKSRTDKVDLEGLPEGKKELKGRIILAGLGLLPTEVENKRSRILHQLIAL